MGVKPAALLWQFQGSICRRIAGIFLVLAVLVVIFLVNGGLSLFATAPN